MTPNDSPQFQFDSPPPFTYQEFKALHFPRVLGVMQGPGADYLRSHEGPEAEFLCRLFYLVIVSKMQNPEIGMAQLSYAVSYGLASNALAQGQSPESVKADLSTVPWDTLPGMDDYDRETANAIASRAVTDALEGKLRSPNM